MEPPVLVPTLGLEAELSVTALCVDEFVFHFLDSSLLPHLLSFEGLSDSPSLLFRLWLWSDYFGD